MVEIEKIREEIKGVSKEQLTELQKVIRLEKQAQYEKKGRDLYGYVSEEEEAYIPLLMQWVLNENENKTIYGLTTKSVKLLIEVVRENREYLPLVLDWLYDEKMIDDKTIYKLITKAVKLVIQSTLDEIRKSGENPRTP